MNTGELGSELNEQFILLDEDIRYDAFTLVHLIKRVFVVIVLIFGLFCGVFIVVDVVEKLECCL